MYLFLALIFVPLIEIALFVTIGEKIGLAWTLAIVLATALLGSITLRRQGLKTFSKLRALKTDMEAPIVVIEGMMVAAAGLLLLTPGFLTDAIGFSLLIPPLRTYLARRLAQRAFVHVSAGFGGPQAPRDPDPGPWPQEPPQGPRPSSARGRGASPWSDEPSVDRAHADEAVILEDDASPRPKNGAPPR